MPLFPIGQQSKSTFMCTMPTTNVAGTQRNDPKMPNIFDLAVFDVEKNCHVLFKKSLQTIRDV